MSDTPDEYELQTPSGGGRFGTGADFGPYVLTRASQYYQGPKSSTRVAAHIFIPIDQDAAEKAASESMGSQFYWNIRGYVFVRFWKKGNLWKYGPCTLQDYRMFRESSSKGRHVRILESYGHGPASESDLGGEVLV